MPAPKRLALLMSLFVLALAACGKSGEGPKPVVVSAPTVRAALHEARECRSLAGEIRARNSVTLASKISGTVVAVSAAEGQVVRKGQVVLRIDDAEVRQRMQGLLSTARQAGLERQALAARSDMARVNLQRMEKLFSQEVVSRDELDRARTEYRALKKQELAMAASAAAAGHQRAEAQSLMGYSVVTAPFTGVLSRRYVDLGAFVSAGSPLAAIDDVQGGYELEARADETLLPLLHPGMQVIGLVPAISSRPFITRLTAVVGSIDPATRTFKIKAAYGSAPADRTEIARGDSEIPPQPRAGMFGKVCVPMTQTRKLLIPAAAVRKRGELDTVLTVDPGRVLRLRLVKLGGAYLQANLDGRWYIVQAQDEMVNDPKLSGGVMREVLSGLAPGEIIVSGGSDALREGDRLAGK